MRLATQSARSRPATYTSNAIDGWVLLIAGLAVGLSAFERLRLDVGGLFVHPYLLVLGVAFVPMIGTRLARFPGELIVPAAGFLFLAFVATVASDRRFGEVMKMGAGFATIAFVAVLVRSPRSFRSGALGLSLSAGALAVYGLATGDLETGGVNPLEEVANKNAFSLYSLPALLLSSHLLFEHRSTTRERTLHAIAVVAIIAATFASGNRSGWLGVVLVGLLLLVRARRFRTASGLVVFGVVAWMLVNRLGFLHVFESRVDQTMAGYGSDGLRWELFKGALSTAFDNPLLGVGKERLTVLLAQWTHTELPRIDPHNLFGHVAGSFGLPALALLLWLGSRLFFPPRSWGSLGVGLTRMLVIVFVVRSQFSREAIYAPSFAIAFGLVLGHALSEGAARQESARASKLPSRPAPTST